MNEKEGKCFMHAANGSSRKSRLSEGQRGVRLGGREVREAEQTKCE